MHCIFNNWFTTISAFLETIQYFWYFSNGVFWEAKPNNNGCSLSGLKGMRTKNSTECHSLKTKLFALATLKIASVQQDAARYRCMNINSPCLTGAILIESMQWMGRPSFLLSPIQIAKLLSREVPAYSSSVAVQVIEVSLNFLSLEIMQLTQGSEGPASVMMTARLFRTETSIWTTMP